MNLSFRHTLRLILTICPALLAIGCFMGCEEEDGDPVGSLLQKTTTTIQSWKHIGRPFSGYAFESIIVGPNNTIVASIKDSGIFVSQDNGVKWLSFSQGLSDKMYFLYMTLGSNNTLYGADDTAIYKREPSGEGWESLTAGIPQNAFINRLYTDYSGQVYLTSAAGLFLLNDSRTSWSQLGGGLPVDAGIRDIAFDRDGSAAALTFEGKIFRSQNSVNGWRSIYIPFYADSAYSIALNALGDLCILLKSRRLIILKTDSHEEPEQLLYAEDIRFYNGIGYLQQAQERSRDPYLNTSKKYTIMRSIDGGKSWSPFYTGLTGFPTDFTFDSQGNGYAGSADGTFSKTINPVK